MIHPFLRAAAAAASVAAAAACGRAPEAPTVDLGLAPDTLAVPYAEIPSAAFVAPGRWAVVSPLDGVAAVVDFGAEAARPLGGRRGTEAEIRHPFAVFAAGDTIHVGDWGLRRLTLWTTDGRFVRAIPAPDATRGTLPSARDESGRFYVELAPPARRDGSGNRDSALILRLPPGLERADTVAQLTPLDMAEVESNGGRRFERRIFSGEDVWGVRSDGSIWVARVYQNRVEWVGAGGERTVGQTLPDPALTITTADREHFLQRFPPGQRSTADRLPISPVKPAFDAGFTDPEGNVWLQKSRNITDSVRVYHVVDRRGRLTRMVRLVTWGRLVAAGREAVLVAEHTPDGHRLLQAPLPAPAPEP